MICNANGTKFNLVANPYPSLLDHSNAVNNNFINFKNDTSVLHSNNT